MDLRAAAGVTGGVGLALQPGTSQDGAISHAPTSACTQSIDVWGRLVNPLEHPACRKDTLTSRNKARLSTDRGIDHNKSTNEISLVYPECIHCIVGTL
jgi:hypothetical protein